MSDKYIIRNCPAIYEYGKGLCCNDLKFDEHTLCQDCTDCPLKQIVEKCKKTKRIFLAESGTHPYAGGRCTEAEGILQLLDIEECE